MLLAITVTIENGLKTEYKICLSQLKNINEQRDWWEIGLQVAA